jgi:hypothetical protein
MFNAGEFGREKGRAWIPLFRDGYLRAESISLRLLSEYWAELYYKQIINIATASLSSVLDIR